VIFNYISANSETYDGALSTWADWSVFEDQGRPDAGNWRGRMGEWFCLIFQKRRRRRKIWGSSKLVPRFEGKPSPAGFGNGEPGSL